VRDSSLRAVAAVAVCAAALLVAGCGGGGKGGAKPVGASNNTSVCAYTKRVGKGRVYMEIAVSRVSLEPTACSAFNASFGVRRRLHQERVVVQHRTRCVHVPHTGTGRAFCRSFHPGHGFRRDFLRVKGNRGVYTLARASVRE
jgi:hypothetical protein